VARTSLREIINVVFLKVKRRLKDTTAFRDDSTGTASAMSLSFRSFASFPATTERVDYNLYDVSRRKRSHPDLEEWSQRRRAITWRPEMVLGTDVQKYFWLWHTDQRISQDRAFAGMECDVRYRVSEVFWPEFATVLTVRFPF